MRAARVLLFLSLFSALYFAIRIPVFPERMLGEDGPHAGVFLLQPESPGFLLIGRVNGQDIFGNVSHPALMYVAFKALGPLTSLSARWRSLEPFWLTFWARAACSLFLFFTLLIFAFAIFRLPGTTEGGRKLALVTLAVLANTHFAIYTSSYFHLDNTVGVLLTGILCTALLAGLLVEHGLAYKADLFAASALFGLGKNAWSIALWIALAVMAAWLLALPGTLEGGRAQRRRWLSLLALVLAGSVAGNLLSYLYSPSAYIGGLELMLTGGGAAGGTWPEKTARWVQFTGARLPFLLPLLGIYSLCAFSLLISRRPLKFPLALILMLSLGLFFTFFVSLALPMPRYFAPAYVSALAALLALQLTSWHPGCNFPLRLVLAALALFSAHFIWQVYEQTYRRGFVDGATPASPSHCIPLLEGAAVLKGGDFAFGQWSRESAQGFLRDHGASKPLCP